MGRIRSIAPHAAVGLLLASALAHAPIPSPSFAGTPAVAAAVERAAPVARGTIATAPTTRTVERDDLTTLARYAVQPGDTVVTIATRFGLRPETVAYNNPAATALRIGAEFRLPALDAAIYVVRLGDSVEAVAGRFATDAARLRELNRLYFEPENFAPGKTILVPVPDGRYPSFAFADRDAVRVAALPSGGGRRVHWPVDGILTQLYSPWHRGVDVAAPYGSGVASDEGIVTAVGTVPVGGLRVCVRHRTEVETCYYHLSAVRVSEGERVRRGQIVAAIGLTGVTTGPHVHWEATYRGQRIDPLAR